MYCAGHMTEDVWFLITPELKMCHYALLPANIDCIAATTHTHWTPLQSANTVVYSFIQIQIQCVLMATSYRGKAGPALMNHIMFPSFNHIEKTYKVIAQVDARLTYIRFPF